MAVMRGVRTSLSRRGFVFTSVATVIVLVLIILAGVEQRTLPRTVVQTERVHTMGAYLQNLEADLPRVAYISAFRSLIAMEEHISATNTHLSDVDGTFTECFTNGTVNGSSYAIMLNSTFTEFSSRFTTLAAKQGMRANLTVLSVRASHDSPWSILVNATILITLSDTSAAASFNRTESVTTSVSIIDIKDPLYSIGTDGRSPHPIHKSNVSTPYITATNNTIALQTLVNDTYYIESSSAPSLLGRFAGNLSASPYGIQSLVDIKEFRAQDLVIDTCRSVVDYKYFGNATTVNYLIINMSQTDFWLANTDLALYNATNKTVGLKICT